MNPSMQKHIITAFYDNRNDANAAAIKLKQFGVLASDVTVSPENARDELGVRSGDTQVQRAEKDRLLGLAGRHVRGHRRSTYLL